MANNDYTESKFWKIINLAGNAIGLNLFFLVSCIPIVTIGPAMSGLYSGVRYLIRREDWFTGFKVGFCKNFLRTAIAGVLTVAMMVYLLLYFNTAHNFYLDGGSLSPMITYGIAMLFPCMIAAALWPLNVYIPSGTADWLRNAVNLICKAPLQVLATAIAMWLPVFLALYLLELLYLSALVILAVYFSLAAFASTLLLKDAVLSQFLKYKEEHPDEMESNE